MSLQYKFLESCLKYFVYPSSSSSAVFTIVSANMASARDGMSHHEKMAQYAPTPSLEKMNPIQRYLHKGELEPWDWIRLALIVMSYFVLRPSIEAAMRWYFDADPGKTSQDARQKAKEEKAKAKISPNDIRSARGLSEKDVSTSAQDATASGRAGNGDDEIVLRRPGKGGSEFSAKTLEQQLLDWDDVDGIQPVEGPRGDITEWVKKWDALE